MWVGTLVTKTRELNSSTKPSKFEKADWLNKWS